MPQINLKLFAQLQSYLPDSASKNAIVLDCAKDHSINAILTGLDVPLERCHLVTVNGVFIPPEQRADKKLTDGDTIAVWPPIAGG